LNQGLKLQVHDYVVSFIEWWGLDNLLSEDYQETKGKNDRHFSSLAEMAYIRYAKAILALNDTTRIETFIPKIGTLAEAHPTMYYASYYYAKLLLAIGNGSQQTVTTVLPFIRKKQNDFWVWAFLAEFYNDPDTQLACYLRASHTPSAKEMFLCKTHTHLISLYLSREEYSRAKYHLDRATKCYLSNGWRMPSELERYTHEAWVNNTVSDASDGIDYKPITDNILAQGSQVALATVTYVDTQSKRAVIVYGIKLQAMVKWSQLRTSVTEGMLLKIHYIATDNQRINIVSTAVADKSSLVDCSYIRVIQGVVAKRPDKDFAFIKAQDISVFVNPALVQRHQLKDKGQIEATIAYTYNKKKDEWSWNCVTVNH
jgi:hypothetical protein